MFVRLAMRRRSKIHTKFDVEFCKSTEVQLKSIGVEWEELWLTAEEKSTVKMYRETGRWTEEEDRDEGKRDEREEEEKDEGVKVSKVVDEEDGGESNGTLRGVLVGAVGVGVLGGAILYLLANRKRRS
ncbi:hypothetical protein TL16_g03900 [Triparma laevis f. inornata]|uniref:Uncharacterized protein n=1 Tax=Triparma laevis f. inornata TaxID=1714386 RepID=A0A9W7E6C1_9STRA|nr:hypothetical protein TL16_g03900 [Triparma laevis f. inornata]